MEALRYDKDILYFFLAVILIPVFTYLVGMELAWIKVSSLNRELAQQYLTTYNALYMLFSIFMFLILFPIWIRSFRSSLRLFRLEEMRRIAQCIEEIVELGRKELGLRA